MSSNSVLIIAPGGLPIPSAKGGAVQNLIEHLISENQRQRKIKLFVITPFDKEAKKIAHEKYENIHFEWVNIPKIIDLFDTVAYNLVKKLSKKSKAISFKSNFKSFYYAYKTALYLQKNDFDRIVIENNVRNFLALKLFKNWKKYAGKYYYHLHNVPRTGLGCKKVIKDCKRILCVSQFIGNTIMSPQNAIGPIDKERVYVYMNCIDTSEFNSSPLEQKEINKMKQRFGVYPDEKVVLFAGRLSREKGILETIRAFKKIDNQNLKLLIVGSDFYSLKTTSDFEKELKKETSNIVEKIVFTGYIPYELMPKIYKIATVAVLPSIWDEPAGLTIIEAMACGTPVITTKVGGIPEYSDDNSSILIERDKEIVDNIALGIIKILQDEKYTIALKKNASKKGANYNLATYYNNFLKGIELDGENN